MLRLRPYKACDAEAVVSWTDDETGFRKWSSDRFDSYPITAEYLNRHYDAMAFSDSFFAMTAFDEAGPVGHLIMRFPGENKNVVRFGFVIVDSRKRCMGYGKEMMRLAIRYAFDILRVEKITMGVFENNAPAYRCYRASGLRDVTAQEAEYYQIMGERWKCLELELLRSDLRLSPALNEKTGGMLP